MGKRTSTVARPVHPRRARCRLVASARACGRVAPAVLRLRREEAEVPVRDASADRLRHAGDLPDLPDEAPAGRGRADGRARGWNGGPGAFGASPGHAPFALSTERQQLIGVTRAPGRAPRASTIEIRAVGTVAYDPRLYQAIVEYREALAARSAQLARQPAAPRRARAPTRIVRAAALQACASWASPTRSSPRHRAAAAATRPTCCCPARASWVYAQVYEYEIELVQPGPDGRRSPRRRCRAHATTARVVAVDPILDPATRTARVRVLVRDARRRACVRRRFVARRRSTSRSASALAVPEDAVLDTGEHQIVFVVARRGRLRAARGPARPRGAGLLRGARRPRPRASEVVTSANFLIDSESRFRAALARVRQRRRRAARGTEARR